MLLLRVASVIFLLYFFFGIDRGNIGFAALQMNRALGMSAEVYGYGSGLFTLAYLLFQMPNAEALRRLGASRGFAAIGCAWGLVSMSTAFVPDPPWFLVNRFLLGVSEAGFHAFMIYYVNQNFPSRVRGFAVAFTFLSIPLSMIVASPLSGFLLDLEIGSLHGWQTLFIIEGIPSVVLGLLCLKLIPDSPRHIRFLTAEERASLERELETEAGPVKEYKLLSSLKASLVNPLVWGLSFILFSMLVAVNVMIIWMPQMIHQVSGAGNLEVGVLNSIPWIAFGVGCLVVSRVSDRIQNRIVPLRASIAIATFGFIIAAILQESHPVAGFCGFLLASFCGGAAQGVFWALTMQMVGGPNSAATFAFITIIGNGSGVLIHPLIGKLRDTTGSFGGVVWALATFYFAAIVTLYLIERRYAAQQRNRELACQEAG